MTNSPFGRIDLDGLLSDLLGKEGGFPGMFTSTTVTTEAPVKVTHKKVSELSVGTVVISPLGEELKITNLSLVDDELIELVFHNADVIELWPNAMLEVK